MYEKAIIHRQELRKMKTAQGILMQNLGRGVRMNGLHWNMEDGAGISPTVILSITSTPFSLKKLVIPII